MCYECCKLAVSQAERLKLLLLMVGKGTISRNDGRGGTELLMHVALYERHL